MTIRPLAIALLFTCNAMAAWERHVGTASGDWNDAPSPHPLAYFRDSECVGKAPNERQPDCKPARTELTKVGSIGKFVIYDLSYYSAEEPGSPGAKSILVGAAAGPYREIYYRGKTQRDASIPATEIIQLGAERILRALYNVGGNYAMFEEDYFSFDLAGNKLMKLDPIIGAAKQQTPVDSAIYRPQSEFDFKAMTWTVGTEPTDTNASAKLACCDGSVTVRFKIVRGDFVPVKAVYKRN